MNEWGDGRRAVTGLLAAEGAGFVVAFLLAGRLRPELDRAAVGLVALSGLVLGVGLYLALHPLRRATAPRLAQAAPALTPGAGPACETCAVRATVHVTQVREEGGMQELHFCEEHARRFLSPDDGHPVWNLPPGTA